STTKPLSSSISCIHSSLSCMYSSFSSSSTSRQSSPVYSSPKSPKKYEMSPLPIIIAAKIAYITHVDLRIYIYIFSLNTSLTYLFNRVLPNQIKEFIIQRVIGQPELVYSHIVLNQRLIYCVYTFLYTFVGLSYFC